MKSRQKPRPDSHQALGRKAFVSGLDKVESCVCFDSAARVSSAGIHDGSTTSAPLLSTVDRDDRPEIGPAASAPSLHAVDWDDRIEIGPESVSHQDRHVKTLLNVARKAFVSGTGAFSPHS